MLKSCACNLQYARARAAEAKWNLFAVLFDYIVHNLYHSSTLTGRQSPGVEEIQAVATTLALAEAPESFALAFKQGLQGVGETITKSIVTAMSRDVTNGRLNAQVHVQSLSGKFEQFTSKSAVRVLG
jgi:hypothetical protein